MRLVNSLALLLAVASCGCYALETGNLTVIFSDTDGKPITNATVKVTTSKGAIWGYGNESEYYHYEGHSDSNGVASIDFGFRDADFSWRVITPSHYSQEFGSKRECFDSVVEESDYLHVDTNTVEGLARYEELRRLYYADDAESYVQYISKMQPKNITYANKRIVRSVCFYPKRNPQPMCVYGGGGRMDLELPRNSRVISSNGVDYVKYDDVEFDLKEGLFLPPWGGRRGGKAGLVSDFKVVRYSVATNGVTERFGWIEFAPGCGAYKRKKTGDDSFPSVYEADTNAVFLSRIQYRSYRRDGAPHGETVEKLLPEDEYMVLRTRVMKDEDTGSITNCHYSKIIGRMYFDNKINFKQSVFNPRPNDPNLEYDSDRNLAR